MEKVVIFDGVETVNTTLTVEGIHYRENRYGVKNKRGRVAWHDMVVYVEWMEYDDGSGEWWGRTT